MNRTIRCAHCKGRHGTIAQVRLCAHRAAEAKAADEQAAFEHMLEQERTFDMMIQQREIEEDRAVAEWKMDRDLKLMGRTRRQRPW